MNERPTHLSLFSGIGGFDLACEAAGFKTIGFSEIDPFACAVLRKRWPSVPNFGAIQNIDHRTLESIGTVNLITGGFPCQPFSCAGQRNGSRDERFLWPECVRVLGAIRPKFALFENVSGLLTIDRGRTFNRILSDLSAIWYDCLWNLVPASALGALHQRDRVWIVAHSGHVRGWRWPVSGEAALSQTGNRCEDVADPSSIRLSGSRMLGDAEYLKAGGDWENAESFNGRFSDLWKVEPNVGRVADGIPKRLDRLKCLGNSVVPQVAYVFAKAIYKQLRP